MTVRTLHVLLACLLGSAVLSGCATSRTAGDNSSPSPGTVLLNAAEGSLAAGVLGDPLTEAGRQQALAAEALALSSGETANWRAPDANAYGQVQLVDEVPDGERSCRDYTHTIFADGTARTAQGRACKGDDGRWRTS